jgi:hypothetical protein
MALPVKQATEGRRYVLESLSKRSGTCSTIGKSQNVVSFSPSLREVYVTKNPQVKDGRKTLQTVINARIKKPNRKIRTVTGIRMGQWKPQEKGST